MPQQVWIDAGYMTDVVYAFVRESNMRRLPPRRGSRRGAAAAAVVQPADVHRLGGQAHRPGVSHHVAARRPGAPRGGRRRLLENLGPPAAGHAGRPAGGDDASTGPRRNEHLALAKHLTAEVKTEEFVAGKGVVTRWEQLRRQNHWFDALYNACAAANLCGVRLVGEEPRPVVNRPVVINAGVRMPDGRILRQEYREGPRIW